MLPHFVPIPLNQVTPWCHLSFTLHPSSVPRGCSRRRPPPGTPTLTTQALALQAGSPRASSPPRGTVPKGAPRAAIWAHWSPGQGTSSSGCLDFRGGHRRCMQPPPSPQRGCPNKAPQRGGRGDIKTTDTDSHGSAGQESAPQVSAGPHFPQRLQGQGPGPLPGTALGLAETPWRAWLIQRAGDTGEKGPAAGPAAGPPRPTDAHRLPPEDATEGGRAELSVSGREPGLGGHRHGSFRSPPTAVVLLCASPAPHRRRESGSLTF